MTLVKDIAETPTCGVCAAHIVKKLSLSREVLDAIVNISTQTTRTHEELVDQFWHILSGEALEEILNLLVSEHNVERRVNRNGMLQYTLKSNRMPPK